MTSDMSSKYFNKTEKSSISFKKKRSSSGSKKSLANVAEESKYKSYLKNVKTLNQMKEYLSSMHKTMDKEVVKRLVISIKRME